MVSSYDWVILGEIVNNVIWPIGKELIEAIGGVPIAYVVAAYFLAWVMFISWYPIAPWSYNPSMVWTQQAGDAYYDWKYFTALPMHTCSGVRVSDEAMADFLASRVWDPMTDSFDMRPHQAEMSLSDATTRANDAIRRFTEAGGHIADRRALPPFKSHKKYAHPRTIMSALVENDYIVSRCDVHVGFFLSFPIAFLVVCFGFVLSLYAAIATCTLFRLVARALV